LPCVSIASAVAVSLAGDTFCKVSSEEVSLLSVHPESTMLQMTIAKTKILAYFIS